MNIIVPSNKIQLYNLFWPKTVDPLSIEMDMIRHGGRWQKKDGTMAGEGMLFHRKRMISILWPWISWNHWSNLQIECYEKYRIIGQIGCASSGKTFIPSACMLSDYYTFPDTTTVLVSSTTRESLEMRVLGEVKKLHRLAKEQYTWIPGNLIEGRQRIVTDDRSASAEGRDFRNGILGVACKKGQSFQGIEEYVGIKNKRMRLLADELQFLPRVFVASISNLNKNPDFKCVGSGNPKDTTDALGVLCEPSATLGGWEGNIDQQPGTKTWEIRFPRGICIQFPGTDSPNLDGKLGIDLITQEQIDADVAFYGRDSLQFSMMDEGKMPKGLGNRRVLTRQMCLKFHAMDDPIWQGPARTKIAFLDAAYRGVGGDRCVFGTMEFGQEVAPADELVNVSAIINQKPHDPKTRQILALTDLQIIPIKMNDELPEDQIVKFVMDQCDQQKIGPENFFYDSGMRTSLVNAFARIWSPQCNAIDCGGFPSDSQVSSEITALCKDYYSKKVTELWFSVRLAVEASQIRAMSEELVMEFCMREWTMVGANKIEVEPKEKTKLKVGRSPDLADAFATGLFGARQRGFMIMKLSAPPRPKKENGPDWRDQARDLERKVWSSGNLTFR